jgi:hypothetical protein
VAQALLGSTARRMAGAASQQSLARLLSVHKELTAQSCVRTGNRLNRIPSKELGCPGREQHPGHCRVPKWVDQAISRVQESLWPARPAFQKDRIVSSLLRSELSVKALA